MKIVIVMILLAAPIIRAQDRPSDTAREKNRTLMEEQLELMRDSANFQTESSEADGDEYKVRSYRLRLKVPAKPTREARMVVTDFRVEVVYHVATTGRHDAQIEAAMLGANATDAMEIDREMFRVTADLNGNTVEATVRYYAGEKLVASRDLLAGDPAQSQNTLDRMLKLDGWARTKSNKK